MIDILGEYLIYSKIIVLQLFKVFYKDNYFDTRIKEVFFFLM